MKRLLRSGERGQALVEFSFAGIVFFLLIFGMVDVGRGVLQYNTLAQATREGTRYAIVHGADSTDPSGPGSAYYTAPNTDTKVTETVTKFSSVIDGDNLTVLAEWPEGANLRGNSVKVTSQYTYQPFFALFGFSFTMTSSSTMVITN